MFFNNMFLLLLVTFVHGACSAAVWREDFNIQVTENQTEFTQRVKIDMLKKQVTIYVPQHNANQDIEMFSDMNLGHSILCYIRDKYCILRNVKDTGFADIASLKEGMERLEMEGGRLSTNNSRLVQQYQTVDSNAISNLAFLSSGSRAFLKSRPLYQSRPFILPPNAKTFADAVDTPLRIERSFTIEKAHVQANLVSNGYQQVLQCPEEKPDFQPELVWGFTSKSCEWIQICGRGNTDQLPAGCVKKHFTQSELYKCYCCPGNYLKSECKCYDANKTVVINP